MTKALPPNPADCEGHQDEDWVLLSGAGIGESLYCNGACVPADQRTDALATLRAEVTTEWTVKITDHDYLADSRDDVAVAEVRPDGLVLRPKKPWSSQGRDFPTMNFTWDKDDRDQVTEGRRVHLYRTSYGSRVIAKTFEFFPPRGY